jgi:hypothetical protein
VLVQLRPGVSIDQDNKHKNGNGNANRHNYHEKHEEQFHESNAKHCGLPLCGDYFHESVGTLGHERMRILIALVLMLVAALCIVGYARMGSHPKDAGLRMGLMVGALLTSGTSWWLFRKARRSAR